MAWVKSLWPEHEHYLDVYHHYRLTGERSVFAHGIHLADAEWRCLHETGSALAFCPTSNLFLGSGLFRLPTSWQQGADGHRQRRRRGHHLQYAAHSG
jgi:guanine deaminase